METNDFKQRLIGKSIAEVHTYGADCYEVPAGKGKVFITRIILDDGTRVELSGVPHPGLIDVTAEIGGQS